MELRKMELIEGGLKISKDADCGITAAGHVVGMAAVILSGPIGWGFAFVYAASMYNVLKTCDLIHVDN